MARGKFRGGPRGKRGGRGGGGQRDSRPYVSYEDLKKTNELFERYYNELALVPEADRDEFWTAMRRELPNSWRMTGSKGHALAVQQRLIDHYIPQILNVKHEGKIVEPPRQIEWFPEKLAWSMTTPKNVIRKFAPFSSFQKFLVSETFVGNISRQEVVSMIPPLLLDVRPGHTVLDMCAAPGSKSAQLIEMLHGGEEARIRKIVHQVAKENGREASPDGFTAEVEKAGAEADEDWSDDGRATGLLVANDREYKRAQMLVHQVKRLNSPNIIVTNHDATQFPSIRIPSETVPRYLKFDRILADVPCSGDGTVRKSPNIWKDWLPGSSLGLHVTQVRILVRALQMLKVGGRVVYSTCSLNPVENEAVISAAIDRCGGVAKVAIIDCHEKLPGLRRTSGLRSWKIVDKRGRIWDSWGQYSKETESEDLNDKLKLVEGMFTPTDIPEDKQIPVERCLRVYPHFQDTGGFFITVLQKLSEIRARPEASKKRKAAATVEVDSVKPSNSTLNGESSLKRPSEEDEEEEEDATEHGNHKRVKMDLSEMLNTDITDTTNRDEPEDQEDTMDTTVSTHVLSDQMAQDDYAPPSEAASFGSKKKSHQPFEEPYKYLREDHPELLKIYEFYEISSRFPKNRYMVRNATGEPVKAIYYTSERVRGVLECNEGQGLKFVQAGVKMFMKQDAQGQDICRWRIQSEGIPILEPWVGEGRVVRLYKQDTLRKLLVEMFPKIGDDNWKNFGEVGEKVKDMGMGCCVLRVETSDDEDGFKERIVLPLWRSINSFNLMLPKEDRKAMLLRLFNDESELVDNSKERQQKADAKIREEAERQKGEVADQEAEDVVQNGHSEETTVKKDVDEPLEEA